MSHTEQDETILKAFREKFAVNASYGYKLNAEYQEIEDYLLQSVKKVREEIANTLTRRIDSKNMLSGWEKYWIKTPNGRYIEKCQECTNAEIILEVITNLSLQHKEEEGQK